MRCELQYCKISPTMTAIKINSKRMLRISALALIRVGSAGVRGPGVAGAGDAGVKDSAPRPKVGDRCGRVTQREGATALLKAQLCANLRQQVGRKRLIGRASIAADYGRWFVVRYDRTPLIPGNGMLNC